MILHFFDRDMRMTGATDEVHALTVSEAKYTCDALIGAEPYHAYGHDDGFVGLQTIHNTFELYRIQTVSEQTDTQRVTVYAESLGYDLSFAPFIHDKRPQNMTAAAALGILLAGTGWQVGQTPATEAASTNWYDISPLEALKDLASVWGVRYGFRVVLSGREIAARYVDLFDNIPAWRGKRYRLGKDISIAKRNVDNRNLATALYGRGKGEPSGDGYGRRINFADVVWSKAAGDPADKPAGQDYVVDEEAEALYGRRYALLTDPQCEDPQQLLRDTWDALQTRSRPALAMTLTVVDLERMGYPHEAARVGDGCLVIVDEWGLETLATVVEIERDYVSPAGTKVTFGQINEGIAARVAAGSGTWDRAGAINASGTISSDRLTGALDVAVTKLLAAQSHFTTDDTGAFLWTADNGQSALRITGAGVQIADHKVGDQWAWTTAITGMGVVATALTTGVLDADRVQITGMIVNPDYPGTFWDLSTGEASFNYLSSKMAYNLLKLWIGKGGGGEYGVILTTDDKVRLSIEPSWGTPEEPITPSSDHVDIFGPDQYTHIRLGHKDSNKGLLEIGVGGDDTGGYRGTFAASISPGEIWMLCDDSQGNGNEIAVTGSGISTEKDITAAGISIQALERRVAALEGK